MRIGKCFLCGQRDGQAFRRIGGRMFYLIDHDKAGRAVRKYYCSLCEEGRTPEIEAAYKAAEQRRGCIHLIGDGRLSRRRKERP